MHLVVPILVSSHCRRVSALQTPNRSVRSTEVQGLIAGKFTIINPELLRTEFYDIQCHYPKVRTATPREFVTSILLIRARVTESATFTVQREGFPHRTDPSILTKDVGFFVFWDRPDAADRFPLVMVHRTTHIDGFPHLPRGMTLEQYMDIPDLPPTDIREYLKAQKEGRWLSKSHALLVGAKTSFGHVTHGWLHGGFRRDKQRHGIVEFKDAAKYLLHYPEHPDKTEFDPDMVCPPRPRKASHPTLKGLEGTLEPQNTISIYKYDPPLVLTRLPGGRKPGPELADKIFSLFRSIALRGSKAYPYRVRDLRTGEVLPGCGIPPRYPEECLKNLLQAGRVTISINESITP